MGVQQHSHQGRRWVEGCVHHPLQPLWTYGHVLWTVQLPTNLPGIQGLHLQRHDHRRMAHHLHRQCPCICRNQKRMPGMDQTGTWKDAGRRPPPQIGQMPFWPNGGGIPGISGQEWGSTHGSHQAQHSTKLGTTNLGKSSPIVHRILQLLLEVHPKLLCDSQTTSWSNQERDSLCLGNTARWHIHQAERNIPLCTGNPHAQHCQTIFHHDWCLTHSSRRNTHAEGCQWGLPPLYLPLSYVLPCCMKLWHIWQGASHNHPGAQGIATLSHGNRISINHHHGS